MATPQVILRWVSKFHKISPVKYGNPPVIVDERRDDRTRTFVALSTGTLVSHIKIINRIGADGTGEDCHRHCKVLIEKCDKIDET